ncbi:rho GTPase-activating protein 27-like isoform X2 [Thalassophryne amazonica]|uniref:rho GTPase-activating protein 27-like isoform X2 n=1 Tax=Thalassophryne amazonica TaxID=390379 RepID=UPI001470F8DF|nr:rho GTPase-activating protein 27-like isoform X2 [Thalassophryne amazonica]
MELVSVQYEFEYTTKDGRLVSIKPDENYILIRKTNEHWWHVRKDQHTRAFYVPAQYMRELPSLGEDPADTSSLHVCVSSSASVDTTNTPAVIRAQTNTNPSGLRPAECKDTRHQAAAASSSTTETQIIVDVPLYAQPLPVRKSTLHSINSLQDDHVEEAPDKEIAMHFPKVSNSHIYETIPELNGPESDSLSSELQDAVAPDITSLFQKVDKSADAASSSSNNTDIDQVQNENVQSAVYVNVAELRQSISESPPSASSSYTPSYLDPEGWEVHVDQESGQEYYHHPFTGHTTWDNPFVTSPTDPDTFTAEESYSQSPVLSPSTISHLVLTSDWEQLVDESSGRPYFYNLMSGETSWHPPEQLSPYSPLMEPMSVHRFQEDGPPPLPEEDYPSEDYPGADQPEVYEELLATCPPTFPKDYSLSHGSRAIIPRASLDRGVPVGWNLTVEPSGTYVFTNEHSKEQWIKSVDDRGQTYYYLRGGSKSQWNLPEAPVAPGHPKVENGLDGDNVFKNWRHSMGPALLSPSQDDGRFVPTHRRTTSDHSSDSSSTGNSPEHNLQNLEKAGILNKTKVSENGKKVRKNWAQTWAVLHGGVLTFYKDPKSTTTGASNKTNHIVPEVTVELRGATIGWASKDKSSKKNVLELKGKNGVEFLIQYDTESIIQDWHKILVDTIRQFEFQDHHSEEEDGDVSERDDKSGGNVEKQRASRSSVTHSSSSAGETEQKRVRTKLMKFLMKRPTLQSVKEKGYIRENVFGCHLATLCEQEKTTVPRFVENCIKAVEKRGLDIDGLYRVSGNLAVIQKLRFKADHDELDLEDGQWEDVHVITGALKLFFRELPEPLFPYSNFNEFINAIRNPDHKTKVLYIRDLVRSLPPPNHDTMKLLFGHLLKVIQYGDSNRMSVQSVAIVFGPTLLRPEKMESVNIAMHMVYQNQIVEVILKEYDRVF